MVPADALVDSAAHYLSLAGFDRGQVIDLRLLDLSSGSGD
jgi:glutamate formiminotransferase